MDDFLSRRATPIPRSNLAERIIEQARHTKAPARANPLDAVQGWLEALFAGFLIPRPAYAMLVFLVAGVVFGVYLEGNSEQIQDDQVSFVYTEDSFNAGEWL